MRSPLRPSDVSAGRAVCGATPLIGPHPAPVSHRATNPQVTGSRHEIWHAVGRIALPQRDALTEEQVDGR